MVAVSYGLMSQSQARISSPPIRSMGPDPVRPDSCGVGGRLRILVNERRGVEQFTQSGGEVAQEVPHGRQIPSWPSAIRQYFVTLQNWR
jgi:hypothetical protein